MEQLAPRRLEMNLMKVPRTKRSPVSSLRSASPDGQDSTCLAGCEELTVRSHAREEQTERSPSVSVKETVPPPERSCLVIWFASISLSGWIEPRPAHPGKAPVPFLPCQALAPHGKENMSLQLMAQA